MRELPLGRILSPLWLLAGLGAATTTFAAPDPVSVRSRSGQFIVHGRPNPAPAVRPPADATFLRLDPTLTAVSLERVRQAILTELLLPDRVRAAIHVSTEPFEHEPPPARIASVHFKDGVGYRVALPERMDKEQFIAVATEVLLLELANQSSVQRECELPPWLAVGLAAELSATSLATLVLEPGGEIVERGRALEATRDVRATLRDQSPLTLDELFLPTTEQFAGGGPLYRACAHLFVHELCRLRGGRASLREMLTHLSESLNWQTTFLRTFAVHFNRLIDVDKWYTLSLVSLTGREPMSVWTRDTTARQLDEILTTPIQVRLKANELPIASTASLQRLMGEWKFERQQPLLLQKVNHLQALRLRTASEYLELVDEYLRVLQSYLGDGTRRRRRPRVDPVVTIRQLDQLDLRRTELRDQFGQRQNR
jgi:hypothetical protein